MDYQLLVSGIYYGPETEAVELDSATREEILSLQYLPKLTKVVACGGPEQSDYTPLRNFCLNTGLEFVLRIGGQEIPFETTQISVEGMTEEEAYLLQYVRGLESVHLVKPTARPETLLALREQYTVTWEVEMAGNLYPDTTREVDLSQLVVEDLAEVERAMAYFPEAELLILGLCTVRSFSPRISKTGQGIFNSQLSSRKPV